MFNEKTLWIIGANSDIAIQFTEKYAQNFGTVVLASRNLEQTALRTERMNLKNANIIHLDLSDEKSVENFILEAPEPYGVIFFAGHIDYDGKNENDSVKNINTTVKTNYLSPLIMIESISKKMRAKGEGFIVFLSSAGEIRGKYSNRFYVSSKKATTAYLEGLMQENEKFSVKTIILKLGHVDTKMLKKLENSRTPLFVGSATKTADFIYKNISKQKSVVKYYRYIWKYVSLIYRLLPKWVHLKIAA